MIRHPVLVRILILLALSGLHQAAEQLSYLFGHLRSPTCTHRWHELVNMAMRSEGYDPAWDSVSLKDFYSHGLD